MIRAPASFCQGLSLFRVALVMIHIMAAAGEPLSRQHIFTESQNYRGWNGHQEIIGSNAPAKAGSLEQVAQVGVQMGLECLQRRGLHNLPGQPVRVLHHPHCEEVLSHVGVELHVLHFVAIAPCPVPTDH